MAFTFFRKYNKLILAVGGSLLMVVFLVPSAGDWFAGSPRSETVGRIGEQKITIADTRRADAEIQLVRTLFQGEQWLPVALPPDGQALTWLLGIEEARQMGLWVSRAEINDRFNRAQVSRDRVAAVKDSLNVSDAFVTQAVRHAMMWQKMRRLALEAVRVSEPEVRHLYQQLRAEAAADFVKIPADHLIDQVEEPTETELRDRFRINRDDAPGQGAYGFGYRFPPRLKLEYIAVPYAPIREAVEISELDARSYYDEHPEEFMPEPADGEGDGDGDAEGAAASADEPLPYTEVRTEIMEMLADRAAERQQRRAVQLISAELAEAMRGIDRDPTTGYYDLPRGWVPPALSAVAERVQADEQVDVLPRVVRMEDRWIERGEVNELEGIGAARLTPQQVPALRSPVGVEQYMSLTRELGLVDPTVSRPIALQEGVASLPVVDPDGTTYIFRVIEARPSQPPTALEEVRDQVVADVKQLKAYQLLNERAESYTGTAGEQGLAALAEELGEDYEVVSTDLFPQRVPFQGRILVTPLDVVGQSRRFVDHVFEMARSLGSADAVKMAPRWERVGHVALENQLALYVVELTDYVPAYAEEYAEARGQLAMILRMMDSRQVTQRVPRPFTYEALAERVGYVPKERQQQPEEPLPGDDEPATTGEEAGESP